MLDSLLGLLNTVFTGIYSILPNSPFDSIIQRVGEIPFLPEFNWFVPVAEILAVLEIWLSVILVYYTYSAIMRIVRMIG